MDTFNPMALDAETESIFINLEQEVKEGEVDSMVIKAMEAVRLYGVSILKDSNKFGAYLQSIK